MLAQLLTRNATGRRATAIVAIACGGMTMLAACAPAQPIGSGGGAQHAHTAAATAALQAAGPVLPAGQTGARAAVPWSRVGPGWILAEYSASQVGPAVGGPPNPKAGPTSLYLIDPAGGKYLIYRWTARQQPPPYPVDWSGDKSRALLVSWGSSNRYQQINLASGVITTIPLSANSWSASYTRPNGLALLAGPSNGTSGVIKRFSLTGQTQLVLGRGTDALDSADGTTVVVGESHGLRLYNNAGGLIRTLPVAGTGSQGGCSARRWWSTGTVLADCAVQGYASGALWLVPVNGARPHRLTPPRRTLPDLGDIGAWQLSSGVYTQALGACGTEFIARLNPDGSVRVVTVPHTTGANNRIISSSTNKLLVRAETGCGGSDSLLWFNPASKAEQWLFHTPRLIQGVSTAIEYGRTSG